MSINEYVVKLAEVLAQSEEYKAFVAAKENLKKNKANEEMLIPSARDSLNPDGRAGGL